jgi:preprotein translocase subunit SecG
MVFLTKALMFLTAVFLILLVLVQRGRGGGLAGALGGMGGQSAFGTKAGDLFTRITIGVAAVWIVLSCFAVWYFSATGNAFSNTLGSNAPQQQTVPATQPGGSAPAGTPDKKGDDKAAPAGTPDKKAAAPADGKAAAPAGTPDKKAAAPADGKAEPGKK